MGIRKDLTLFYVKMSCENLNLQIMNKEELRRDEALHRAGARVIYHTDEPDQGHLDAETKRIEEIGKIYKARYGRPISEGPDND